MNLSSCASAPSTPNILRLLGLLALRCAGIDLEKYKNFIGRAKTGDLNLLPDLAQEPALQELSKSLEKAQVCEAAQRDLNSWKANGIESIALGEELYPKLLMQIHKPPPILFYKGTFRPQILSKTFVAIVGSRKADSLGCDLAREFSAALSACTVCVVSGLAYGIDGHSHQGALSVENDCPTIAVLGHGLDSIYPRAHLPLAAEILAKGGLLISQFEPGVPAYPQNFLNRNRLIAGLCKAVIIIQAGQRSGALSTVRHALENGRDVLVVPGPLRHDLYTGSNRLLKEGAAIITEQKDIFDYLPEIPRVASEKQENANCLSPVQKLIIRELQKRGQLHYSDLNYQDVGVVQLAKEILELELQGRIMRLPGDYLREVK